MHSVRRACVDARRSNYAYIPADARTPNSGLIYDEAENASLKTGVGVYGNRSILPYSVYQYFSVSDERLSRRPLRQRQTSSKHQRQKRRRHKRSHVQPENVTISFCIRKSDDLKRTYVFNEISRFQTCSGLPAV